MQSVIRVSALRHLPTLITSTPARQTLLLTILLHRQNIPLKNHAPRLSYIYKPRRTHNDEELSNDGIVPSALVFEAKRRKECVEERAREKDKEEIGNRDIWIHWITVHSPVAHPVDKLTESGFDNPVDDPIDIPADNPVDNPVDIDVGVGDFFDIL